MKARNILLSLLLMVAGLQTSRAQKMIVRMTDSSVTEFDVTKVADVTFVEASPTPDPGNHEWVDLGLPSGTLWATCNVGANSPEEYGDYFAWGETEPKDNYDWSTYRWCNGSNNTMTKYCTRSSYGYNGFADGKTELDAADDAATVNWGSNWQMPSKDQIDEIIYANYTTMVWTTQGGVNGTLITSKINGNSIFLPTAGYRWDVGLYGAGSSGRYWSRSLYTYADSDGYSWWFNSSNDGSGGHNRHYASSVRPVRK